MAEEELVGIVEKFFAQPGVAAVKVIRGAIKKGDTLRYVGHTTNFADQVASMQVNNQPVEEAKAGDFIGVKVKQRVRENDKVYKVLG
jgi:putative protease